MPVPRSLAAVLVAVLAAALLACGGDDDQRLSQEEFVAQAEAICAASDDRMTELFADMPSDRVPTEEELDAAVDRLVPELLRVFDDLESLVPPEELEDDVDELVAMGRRAVAELDEGGGMVLLTGQDPFEDANRKAGELGLDRCAD
jgi:hypothetical protein